MCLYIKSAAAAAALCVAILLLLLQQLLLAAAVRRRVPDGKKCSWFIESDSIQRLLSLQTRFIFNVYCRIYGLDLPLLHPR